MMNSKQVQLLETNAVGKSQVDRADIVIIGNGIAGLTAAVEARHQAPDKRIVIITDQLHPTINTPALKQFAIAKLAREQLLAYPSGTERIERIHVVTAHVEKIHAQSKYINLSGNRGFGYDTLLIATGSSPTGLPAETPGRDFDGVMMLHRLQDYLDFRRRIGEVSEAVVVGGGVHAIETVMGLLYWGKRVHWLIRSTIMGKMLDSTASEMVLNNVRRAGVIIHTETEIAGVVGRVGSVVGVITNHQEMIPCQLVLSCVGTRPALNLAKQCTVPMKHKNGILVDDKLRTSVRDIYAAGDVAALPNPQTGGYEPRAQWFSAVSQGRLAGAMMVGNDENTQASFGVQWHATHLGELSMLTVGEPLVKEPGVQALTDVSQGNYRRISILDDRLVGYLSVGTSQQDSLAIKRIIDEGLPIRNIIKPLLKGNFDAREYSSQQRSRNAQGIVSRKIPALLPAARAATSRLPETDNTTSVRATRPLDNTTSVRATRPLDNPEVAELRPAARVALPVAAEAEQRQDPLVYEEEISPFSGNLPAASAINQRAKSTNPAISQRVAVPYNDITEDFNPFSGNLPALNAPVRNTDSLRPVARGARAEPLANQPAYAAQDNAMEDDFNPFSGNLPVLKNTDSLRPMGRTGRADPVVNQPAYAAQGNSMEDDFNPFSGNLPALNAPVRNTGELRPVVRSARGEPVLRQPYVAAAPQEPKSNLWAYMEPVRPEVIPDNQRKGR